MCNYKCLIVDSLHFLRAGTNEAQEAHQFGEHDGRKAV